MKLLFRWINKLLCGWNVGLYFRPRIRYEGKKCLPAFVLGDFGAAFLTGWGNRYLLAGAVLAAMGLLVLGGLFAGKYRAIFLATVLLAREESETDN